MPEKSFEPPFTVDVDGEVKGKGIPSEESARMLAQDFARRNPSSRVEVFDRSGKSLFFSQTTTVRKED